MILAFFALFLCFNDTSHSLQVTITVEQFDSKNRNGRPFARLHRNATLCFLPFFCFSFDSCFAFQKNSKSLIQYGKPKLICFFFIFSLKLRIFVLRIRMRFRHLFESSKRGDRHQTNASQFDDGRMRISIGSQICRHSQG